MSCALPLLAGETWGGSFNSSEVVRFLLLGLWWRRLLISQGASTAAWIRPPPCTFTSHIVFNKWRDLTHIPSLCSAEYQCSLHEMPDHSFAPTHISPFEFQCLVSFTPRLTNHSLLTFLNPCKAPKKKKSSSLHLCHYYLYILRWSLASDNSWMTFDRCSLLSLSSSSFQLIFPAVKRIKRYKLYKKFP